MLALRETRWPLWSAVVVGPPQRFRGLFLEYIGVVPVLIWYPVWAGLREHGKPHTHFETYCGWTTSISNQLTALAFFSLSQPQHGAMLVWVAFHPPPPRPNRYPNQKLHAFETFEMGGRSGPKPQPAPIRGLARLCMAQLSAECQRGR